MDVNWWVDESVTMNEIDLKKLMEWAKHHPYPRVLSTPVTPSFYERYKEWFDARP